MESMTLTRDTKRAHDFFEQKLAFTLGPIELQHLMKDREQFSLIDVRAAEDFEKGHIPGAISLPEGKWENAQELSKDKVNIIYCYSQQCHLAAWACSQFSQRGFPVKELEGGFEVWKQHELEIEREPVNRLKTTGEMKTSPRH